MQGEALVGFFGADASRSYSRPPVNIDGARRRARELGVLARARNTIVVYHRAFIAGDVVAGYATVPDAPERGVVVRYPHTDATAAGFAEAEHRPDVRLQGGYLAALGRLV